MPYTLATMAVSTIGISVQTAIPTVSVIFMDLLGNVLTIGRIPVNPFRYHINHCVCSSVAVFLTLVSCLSLALHIHWALTVCHHSVTSWM